MTQGGAALALGFDILPRWGKDVTGEMAIQEGTAVEEMEV